MNTEQMAEAIADLLTHGDIGVDVIDEPEQDMRSGGYFLDVVDAEGEQFTILITRGY